MIQYNWNHSEPSGSTIPHTNNRKSFFFESASLVRKNMRELREYKKYKNRALVSKVNEGVFMNNYFVLLWKMQKQKHFRCAQNEFKIYVFKTCKIAIRFFCLFMQFHFMLLSTNTEGFQPSQNTIGKPQVYMNFFIIQIYCHALIFI